MKSPAVQERKTLTEKARDVSHDSPNFQGYSTCFGLNKIIFYSMVVISLFSFQSLENATVSKPSLVNVTATPSLTQDQTSIDRPRSKGQSLVSTSNNNPLLELTSQQPNSAPHVAITEQAPNDEERDSSDLMNFSESAKSAAHQHVANLLQACNLQQPISQAS